VAIVFADQVREDTKELMKILNAQEFPSHPTEMVGSPSKFIPAETNSAILTANVRRILSILI
jgi:hypothetical protein